MMEGYRKSTEPQLYYQTDDALFDLDWQCACLFPLELCVHLPVHAIATHRRQALGRCLV